VWVFCGSSGRFLTWLDEVCGVDTFIDDFKRRPE